MSDLITGKLLNLPKIHIVKYLTQSVCFNHWSNIKCTPNQLSKIANTNFLITSLVNQQMNTNDTQ